MPAIPVPSDVIDAALPRRFWEYRRGRPVRAALLFSCRHKHIGIMTFDDVTDVVRRRMSRIRKTDSKPEKIVRQIAHRLGYRFRKNRRDLPGTPDIVFPSRRKIIFVHGCFWHQHPGCRLAKQPRSRLEYWLPKLTRNVERDATSELALSVLGWESLTIWECETNSVDNLEETLRSFLG